MKSFEQRLALAGFYVAACFLLFGCDHAGSSKKISPEITKQMRLDWNLKTTVEAYEEDGNVNPAWDAFATNALIEFARSRCGVADENSGTIIATNCAAAMDAGCDDPMIRYLYIKYAMSHTNGVEQFAEALEKVAQTMEKSSYPTIRKFYVNARAVEQIYYAYRNNAPPNTLRELIDNMENEASNLAHDKSTPPEEVYEACSLALHQVSGGASEYQKLYHDLERRVFENWPDESTSWLLKGEAYVAFAWQARGGGYADTVTSDGWKTFSKDLDVAEKALNRAWELNPTDTRIPLQMLNVKLGKGDGRDQMELWFNRAMQLDPDDYDICDYKLNYIEPKWYGSNEEMLDFGHECVASTNWGGRVPLILVNVHTVICSEYPDATDRTNYWKQPAVWADIKSAYEKFFQLNPNAKGYYPYYAWYAYQAEDWITLNQLIPKLDSDDYYAFGSKDEFDKMIQLTKEHSSQTANSP